MGSPPPAGSKKVVLKFLSVNNIVIAPAKTGKESSNNMVVIRTDHTNKGNLCIVIPGTRMFNMVVIKFMELNIEDRPAK